VLGTSIYLLVFRILHITAGVAWGGAVFLLVFFLQPASASLGPAAGPFLGELLGRRKLVDAILWVAAFTVGAGLFLYWHDWQTYGSLGHFLDTGFGLSLTIGAASALVAFLIGLFGTKPNVDRLMRLAAQVAEAGGSPPAGVAAEIPAIQARLKTLARVGLTLIVVAVVAMATARYW
jgi:hypothetical protein